MFNFSKLSVGIKHTYENIRGHCYVHKIGTHNKPNLTTIALHSITSYYRKIYLYIYEGRNLITSFSKRKEERRVKTYNFKLKLS